MISEFSSIFGTIHGIFLKMMEFLIAACMFAILQQDSATELAENVMFYGYIFSLEMLIFIPCYFSSNLYNTSSDYVSDLFSSEWHNADLKYQKMMIIFMENLKRPISLDVWLHSNLNLEKFTEVKFDKLRITLEFRGRSHIK